MKNMKLIKSVGGGVALLLSVVISSHASLVTQGGGSQSVSLASATEGFSGAGATLQDEIVNAPLVGTFGTSPPAGSLSSWVYSGNTLNPFGSSDLTFIYQLTITGDQAETLSLALYPDSSVYVDSSTFISLPGGASLVASSATPTTGILSDDDLNFDFLPNPVNPESSPTVYIIVNTSDTTYSQNTAAVIDGLTSGTSDLAPVPEPATIMSGVLLLLPFGASTLRILRKNRSLAV
jgi:hypothetical protein